MTSALDDSVRMVVFVSGLVQGVGFRWWTRAQALELGLTGHARNTDDGRVEVDAEGPRPASCWSNGSPSGPRRTAGRPSALRLRTAVGCGARRRGFAER